LVIGDCKIIQNPPPPCLEYKIKQGRFLLSPWQYSKFVLYCQNSLQTWKDLWNRDFKDYTYDEALYSQS
jgi:hypothetical protein